MKSRRIMSGIITTVFLTSSVMIPGSMVFADSSVRVDEKNFPDENFRKYICTFDNNSDGVLDEKEISEVHFIQCDDMDIESLKGIEFFPKTYAVTCRSNRISEIDLSKNPELGVLYCDYNQIYDLDLSKNTELTELQCSNNYIANLDVSNLPKLKLLYCEVNQIKSLKMGSKESLQELDCSSNKLAELDLSDASNLQNLFCRSNELITLDLSNCHKLEYVESSFNKLTSVDLGANKALQFLNVSQNQLKAIDITNAKDLIELNISYNQITELDTSKNESLNVIYCYNNQLKGLDLSNNTCLTHLGSSRNQIGKFDVSMLKDLMYFSCGDCNLTSLDISNNSELIYLSCENNALTSLDLSHNPKLWFLEASNNNLTALDVSEKPDLATLSIHGNNIKSVDLSTSLFAIPGWGTVLNDSIMVTNKIIFNQWDGFYTIADDYDSVAKFLEYDESTYEIAMRRIYIGDIQVPYFESILAVDDDTEVIGTDFDIAQIRNIAKPEEHPDNNSSVEDFAERLYTTCLGRESELEGKSYWAATLRNGTTGAEVAEGFFFSPEYEKRALCNEDFIETLYETFMGRIPAKAEIAYWSSEMNNGMSRKDVFDGFVNSPEWANICLGYGIRSGGTAVPTYEKDASEEVIAFAKRLYTTCLGREAEEAGLKYWAQELANLRQTGTVAARGFFFSEEFIGLNLDDEEYVTRLYRTFMGREPEEEGFKYWVGELKSGKTRQDVFDGFSLAQEFMMLCSKAGIMR